MLRFSKLSFSRFLRGVTGIALMALLSSSLGCAMCCAPYDYDYSAFGGATPRADHSCGRVGSAFEPAGGEIVHDGFAGDGFEGEVIVDEGVYYEH